MLNVRDYTFWFVTGSQHLYGEDTLREVEEHSKIIASQLNNHTLLNFKVEYKPILTTADAIRKLCIEANADDNCAGIITWMHTFSPAKMWIAGLSILQKPLLHLHTQFNKNIPWDSIDMDFMNLNQSAHGDREFGFIGARMNIPRKVITGFWQDEEVIQRIREWTYSSVAFMESKSLKVARFGDNMRDVAVTEGDKVEAQIKFGWSINGYGIGDLVERVNDVSSSDLKALLDQYTELYEIDQALKSTPNLWASIEEQARIEIGLRNFLIDGNFGAFTTTFEDLHGMKQLPGLAVQRLMGQGYGFGGEGDWKTAAMTRILKIMAAGEKTSFMEDYTYHFEKGNELILGAHMLEICPTIAASKPKLEVHPLSIGGKADPARMTFDGLTGKGVVASLVDLGNRFRLIVNEVEAVKVEQSMPNLPVARVLWKPEPSLRDSTEAWIYAGGAHHTVFSLALSPDQLSDWAEMTGIECVFINNDTKLGQFRNELRWNDIYWSTRTH